MSNKKREGLGAEMTDKWINICRESMRLDFSSPEHTESQTQSMSSYYSEDVEQRQESTETLWPCSLVLQQWTTSDPVSSKDQQLRWFSNFHTTSVESMSAFTHVNITHIHHTHTNTH